MSWLDELLSKFLPGYKTYIGAIGLIGLGLYQVSQGQFDIGVASILAGITALGMRNAISQV